MLKRFTKWTVRGAAGLFGLEVRRHRRAEPAPTAPTGPVMHGDSTDEFLRHLARCGLRPRCVLDVGANEGKWARAAAEVFPAARLVLIEPQEEMRPRLEAFCAAHPSARHVPAGAAAESGHAVQTIWDDFAGSSFLPPPDDALLRAGRQRTTPMVTIDSVFASEPHLPELVKLDVQGYELEALKGANRLFGRTEVFVLEVSLIAGTPGTPELSDVVEFMRARGYVGYDVCGYLRRPLDAALGQFDLAFARADGLLRRDRRWSAE